MQYLNENMQFDPYLYAKHMKLGPNMLNQIDIKALKNLRFVDIINPQGEICF